MDQAGQQIPLILALRKQGQEDGYEFKTSLVYLGLG